MATSLTRVARSWPATLTHTFEVDETPTDAAGVVSVVVTDANTALVTSGTATHAGTGVYTYALPAQAALAELTVSWSGSISGTTVAEVDLVEIVGGFYFSLAEGRNSDAALSDPAKYTAAALAEARVEVEQECEEITGRAFVPRYRRVVLDGSGSSELLLPDADIRTIRAARVASRADGTFVPLNTAQLAALVPGEDDVLRRVDYLTWTEGRGNVILEYEYGLDAPPSELKRKALLRLRSQANVGKSGIPDRALSFSTVEGGTYRMAQPSRYSTGIPDIDAVYLRYARGAGGGKNDEGGALPASRPMDFDPQYLSLYHGGKR